MVSPFSIELCELFVTILEHDGSLSQCANALTQTVSSLSKQVKPLLQGGDGISEPWLAKSGKRFVLTAAGRAIEAHARDIVNRWRQFQQLAKQGTTRTLTVACGQEAAGAIVLQAAVEFRRKHPDVHFQIAVTRGQRRLSGLCEGKYDVALLTDSAREISERATTPVDVQNLVADELGLACATNAPWFAEFNSRQGEVPPSELLRYPLILPEVDSSIRQFFDRKLTNHVEGRCQVALSVGGWRVLRDYVLASFGVGLLPYSLAHEMPSKLIWRPLPVAIRPTNQLRLVTLQQPIDAKVVSDFTQVMRQHAQPMLPQKR